MATAHDSGAGGKASFACPAPCPQSPPLHLAWACAAQPPSQDVTGPHERFRCQSRAGQPSLLGLSVSGKPASVSPSPPALLEMAGVLSCQRDLSQGVKGRQEHCSGQPGPCPGSPRSPGFQPGSAPLGRGEAAIAAGTFSMQRRAGRAALCLDWVLWRAGQPLPLLLPAEPAVSLGSGRSEAGACRAG